MIGIALQTALSLLLCFAIGFVTAWIIRGGREQRGFETFFNTWRSRYDQLERNCDGYLARISALQKELAIVKEHSANLRPTATAADPEEALTAEQTASAPQS
jgi:hypothetical protein